jgi:hypothetical protein
VSATYGFRPTVADLACVVAALLCFAAVLASDGEGQAPMRNEDVVRMLVRGHNEEAILVAIRSRPAEFDLSPEMQDELRLAGVGEELIRAMAERMVELTPEAEPSAGDAPATPEAPPGRPRLALALAAAGDPDAPAVLRLSGTVDARLRHRWQLDRAAENEPFEDVALFLVCREATHVPDHWRSKSPLGRDFISMPRHRVLTFLSAAEAGGAAGDAALLELELPRRLEVELPEDGMHDLALGIAIQAAGRYLRWTDDVWEAEASRLEQAEMEAEIGSARDGTIEALEVRLLRKDGQAEPD